MNYQELKSRYNIARRQHENKVGEAKSVILELKSKKQEVVNLKQRIEDLDKIAVFLGSYADERQTIVQKQIEGIVTAGLRTIFNEKMTFRIDNKVVGKRFEIDFVLVSEVDGSILETSIMDARGGGVAAVAAFLLQAALVLLTPNLRPILFLDESFANVSREYEEALSLFISELCDRTPLQVVLVTHSSEYEDAADKVYRFSQNKGITSVEEVVS